MRRYPHSVPVRVGLMAVALLLACTGVWGQEEDPPTRAGRLSAAEGSVSLEPAGMSDWTALNVPSSVNAESLVCPS